MNWNDAKLERVMGNLLRIGVSSAASVVLLGGLIYLSSQSSARPNYRRFHSEPSNLRSLQEIAKEATALHSAGIIQLGLILLICTPVVRVAFAVLGFAAQRDLVYTAASLIVLSVLLYGLLAPGI